MNINETTDFFKNLISKTDNKSEIRVYEKFIAILTDLKNRDLTEKQLQLIEQELHTLKLNEYPENRIKYLKRQLSKLIEYLKSELSLITEGYYTGIGTAMGVAFGAAYGTMTLSIAGYVVDIPMGVSIGMIIGLLIGASMDAQAVKQNRVLRTR